MLAIILVLYLTTRRRRAEALARGRELERFITYVCGANDVVGEVDVSNGTRVLYGVSDGRVMQQTESYSLEKDLLPHIHPTTAKGLGRCWEPTVLADLRMRAGRYISNVG